MSAPRKRRASATPAASESSPATEPQAAAAPEAPPAPARPIARSPRDIAAALNADRAASAEAGGEGESAADGARAAVDDEDDENFDVDADYVAPPPLREMARDRSGIAELLLFRVGGELFATGLADVEEAVERAAVHPLPHMPGSMLGVFDLRGSLVPIYSPSAALGVELGAAAGTLVLSGGGRRVAIAVDEVSDVIQMDISTLRAAPATADPDKILLGVARRGADLVSVVDGEALVAACAGAAGA